MASPDGSEDDAGATQDAASVPTPRAGISAVRADLPVYRPRNHRARAIWVGVLIALVTAVLVWLALTYVS
jgi:hypothetical protein